MFLSACVNNVDKNEIIENVITDIFDNMTMKEVDYIIDHFHKDIEPYAEYYSYFLEEANNTYDYTPKELSIDDVGKGSKLVKVVVSVSGLDTEGNKRKFETLYTFVFVPVSKVDFKITGMETEYSI